MGEIKSSWEIAMEKLGKLKELTPDELKKQEEERYTQIGKALAERYLQTLTLRQLEVELGKYGNAEKELLSRIVASSLPPALDLGNYDRLEKVVKGITYLEQRELPAELVEGIKNLFREYDEAKKKAAEEVGRSGAEVLSQLGISGSAIARVNIKATPDSSQIWDRTAQPFHDRLEGLKQNLLQPPVK